MEQFKIPVDVQIEDKIVGPLTLRHLIIVSVGGGIAYMLYILLSPRYFWPIWLPPTLFMTGLTIAFAFIKIHDMTFFQFILATIQFNLVPRKRIWKKGDGDAYISVINPPKLKEKNKKTRKTEDKSLTKDKRIEEILKIVESPQEKEKNIKNKL